MSEKSETSVGRDFGAASTQYVTFVVGDRRYGVDITSVAEIRQWTTATPLPHQPRWTRGVLNLRGAIVPVHDLRARFGGEMTEPTSNHAVVIASIRGQSVGVLVDAVSDIVTVAREDIRDVPADVNGGDERTVCGLVPAGEQMIALLDLELLFPEPASAA